MDFRTRYFCAQNNNVIMDLGYNLFKQEQKPFVKQPDLTVPKVYDPSKDVADNLAGKGNPIGADVAAHYRALAPKQPSTTPTTTLNVDPNSDTAGADAISKLFTPPEEEERKRRASIANQRIAAVGDALRHIGNIYYTTKGAPAQKFNNPVKEEEDRYQKEKAIRDRNNQYYMTYQRAKERQEQLAEHNKQVLLERIRANQRKEEELKRKNDWYMAFKEEVEKNKEEHAKKKDNRDDNVAGAKVKQIETATELNKVKIANGGKLPKGGTNSSSSSSSKSNKGSGVASTEWEEVGRKNNKDGSTTITQRWYNGDGTYIDKSTTTYNGKVVSNSSVLKGKKKVRGGNITGGKKAYGNKGSQKKAGGKGNSNQVKGKGY